MREAKAKWPLNISSHTGSYQAKTRAKNSQRESMCGGGISFFWHGSETWPSEMDGKQVAEKMRLTTSALKLACVIKKR